MSGKSTLLRSITASALLANCGLACPVAKDHTYVPRYSHPAPCHLLPQLTRCVSPSSSHVPKCPQVHRCRDEALLPNSRPQGSQDFGWAFSGFQSDEYASNPLQPHCPIIERNCAWGWHTGCHTHVPVVSPCVISAIHVHLHGLLLGHPLDAQKHAHRGTTPPHDLITHPSPRSSRGRLHTGRRCLPLTSAPLRSGGCR